MRITNPVKSRDNKGSQSDDINQLSARK